MGVKGKLVSQITIMSKADVFKLYRFPNHFTEIAPQLIQSVDLLAGEMGAVGSLIYLSYTQGGKKMFPKEMIETLDEKNKSLTHITIEGDLLNSYNAFNINFGINNNREDTMITYILEYEKKSEIVPDPNEFMECFLQLEKEIESHSDVLVPN